MKTANRRNLIEVYTNCYGRFGIKTAIEWIPKTGIKHIELAIKPHRGILVVPESLIVTGESSEKEVWKLKTKMAKEGVIALSCNGGGVDILTFEGVKKFKNQIILSRKIGSQFLQFSPPHPEDKVQRRKIIDRLLEIGDYALGYGVAICFETHPGMTRNAGAMLRLMRELNHRNLRLNFDTGNIYYWNKGLDCETELKRVAEYVSHVHLKESRFKYHDFCFPALGEGKMNFKRIFKALNANGFYGPFSIEIEGVEGEKECDLEAAHLRVKKSIAHLRQIGVIM